MKLDLNRIGYTLSTMAELFAIAGDAAHRADRVLQKTRVAMEAIEAMVVDSEVDDGQD